MPNGGIFLTEGGGCAHHAHTHTHMHARAHAHARTHARTHVCTRTCTPPCTHTRTHTHTCTHAPTHPHTHMPAHLHTYAPTYPHTPPQGAGAAWTWRTHPVHGVPCRGANEHARLDSAALYGELRVVVLESKQIRRSAAGSRKTGMLTCFIACLNCVCFQVKIRLCVKPSPMWAFRSHGGVVRRTMPSCKWSAQVPHLAWLSGMGISWHH